MKVAVCFYGKLTTKGMRDERSLSLQIRDRQETIRPELSYRTFRPHFLDIYEPDIFIHSWETTYREELYRLYNPRAAIVESQIDFEAPPGGSQNMVSCWYSMKSAVDQMAEYEISSRIRFDYVVLTRLDLLYFSDFDLASYDPGTIHIPWHPANHLYSFLLDWYYISSSENILKLSRLFDYMDTYAPVPHATIGYYIRDKVTPKVNDSRTSIVRDVMIPRYMNMIFHPTKTGGADVIMKLLRRSKLTKRALYERYGIDEAEWDDYGYDNRL